MKLLILCILLCSIKCNAPGHTASNVARIDIILFPDVAQYLERKKSIHCLATMVYGEARSESRTGQIAVAYTAKNRAKRNSTVCKEVIKPYQYSVFNKNKTLQEIALDTNLTPVQTNAVDTLSWEDAKEVATKVYDNHVADPTRGATHYINIKLTIKQGYKIPLWTKKFKFVASIERHKFYKS